jgi:hypothetical protein
MMNIPNAENNIKRVLSRSVTQPVTRGKAEYVVGTAEE